MFALCARLPELLERTQADLPDLLVQGLGVVRIEGNDRALFAYNDAFGAAGYLPRIVDLPEVFRPRLSGQIGIAASDLLRNPTGLVESRLMHPWYAEEVRQPVRLQQVFTLPLPGAGPPAILVAGFSSERALRAPDIARFEATASVVVRLLDTHESPEEELERLRRLEGVEQLLPAFFHVLDIREIFERLSEITRDVVPHDFATIALFSESLLELTLHAGTSSISAPSYTGPMPFPPSQTAVWVCRYVPDMQEHPTDRLVDFSAKAGGRASIRVVIRLDDRTIGAVSFASRERACYTMLDLAIARRVADYIALAISHQRAAEEVRRVAVLEERNAKLEMRVRTLSEELDARAGYRRMAGESKEWKHVLAEAAKVSGTDTTVLLLGESGTGKEVVARFLHRASPRHNGPFIALNCAALPEHLLEAELFGYERGAYTGAVQSKAGQLELASGGILFLDEVAEMSLSAQAKFLRVLQEREFQRLGGTRVLHSDARIVAATNRDLELAITQGKFREDLYYRLNVFTIQLPPLRERRDDILALTEAFLTEFSQKFGRPPTGLSSEARRILQAHSWPGNVRELRNCLERAAILCEGGLITPDHLPVKITSSQQSQATAKTLLNPTPGAEPAGDLVSIERSLIQRALETARFNKSKAAKALGLTRQQLYVRMRRYGLL